MPVTILDIARQVNLSHTTVSRVLNGRTAIHIPEATRSRVLAVARELGYRPNLSARALVTGRSKLIALQLYHLNSSFGMEVARQLQILAWQDGYEVLVHEFLGDDTNLRSVVDGVLLLDRIFHPVDTRPLAEEPTPHVALGSFYIDTIDSVGVDLRAASREAMDLLLSTGRERVIFVGRQDAFVERVDGRIGAYHEAMVEAGLPPVLIHSPANTRIHGRQALLDHLGQCGVPEAVFCQNDELAMGCYRALHERGLRIPDDVAVIGCDDIDEGQFLTPALTTISQPISALCETGWAFLKNRMEDRTCALQQAMLPASLTLRESHGHKRKKRQ
jgi:LacI family transcriptional regulator